MTDSLEPLRSPTPTLRETAALSPLAALMRLIVFSYRYSLSMLIGRRCRYLPTCSDFADEAIARHGAWAGGWMAAGRVCRCHPWGGDGFDPVPSASPSNATWFRPWRYARRANELECSCTGENGARNREHEKIVST